MNKLTFDFDKEEMIMVKDGNEIVEVLPGLKDRRDAIMAAAGIMRMELDLPANAMEALADPDIDFAELAEKVCEIIEDSLKSKYPQGLN